MKPMTDDEFRAVFREHKEAVYQFAWRMTNSPSTAEDILQETFLTLWRGGAELDHSRGSLRALLLGIARHLAWRYWRRERRWTEFDEEDLITAAPPVETLEVQEAIGQAVARLPPLQREALVLATYSGLSLEEIADTTDAEVGTVKARLHRARENLKRMLAAYKPAQERQYGSAK
jgi:RNA polymerase sigma-70 factor, ECF subfamily